MNIIEYYIISIYLYILDKLVHMFPTSEVINEV